jgi:integrase
MAAKTTKRRAPGEGSVGSYRTKTAGTLFYWKATVTQPDGTKKQKQVRGFETKRAAMADMREALSASDKGGFTEPSKQPLGDYLATWLDGLRLAPSTVASYRKNVRLHIRTRIGTVPLASLTPGMLTKLYRDLEQGGRADHREGEGLSARTVRYIHTILGSALRDAVDSGLLAASPAAKAKPPTAKQARSPEMHVWSGDQLRAFLDWAQNGSELAAAWHVLGYTGMRRGELLALRWRDVDLRAATITVRRSVGVVRNAGEGAEIEDGPTKTDKPRMVDIDASTVAVLRAHKQQRGEQALVLARDDALVFGDLESQHRHPERFSRLWNQTVTRAIAAGIDVPPVRLHDLRHTHATVLLSAGVPVHVVSQRLGHASPVITMTVYAHVLPGSQREAADLFARLIGAA